MKLPRSIFHAHNWQFTHVRRELKTIQAIGFQAIQISPAQKSPRGDAWYLRYQPFDHLTIEGLGGSDELRTLCDDAKKAGLIGIADVVFNHMAVPPDVRRSDWLSAEAARVAGNPTPMKKLRAYLDGFPHLNAEDFQPWRDMQGADWDNDNRYDSWGNGEWPELIPNTKVIDLHIQHLTHLYKCGVRGFRFDAVKHMRVSHLRLYIDAIRNFSEECYVYGEVFSGDPAMHSEYNSLFPTTDFPFLLRIREKLIAGKAFSIDSHTDVLSQESIRFGRNHDTALNPPSLVAGFIFPSAELTLIASCISLLVSGGSVLVYVDDYNNAVIRKCLDFRNRQSGLVGEIRVEKSGTIWHLNDKNKKLILDSSAASLQCL